MSDKHIIQTEEEYTKILNTLAALWNGVEDTTKTPYPNIEEISQLEEACVVWDKRRDILKEIDLM
tara:strand:+ start:1535 stop:1729 length:195 start_codon:yes stop_codon:yes gene_type:complete